MIQLCSIVAYPWRYEQYYQQKKPNQFAKHIFMDGLVWNLYIIQCANVFPGVLPQGWAERTEPQLVAMASWNKPEHNIRFLAFGGLH